MLVNFIQFLANLLIALVLLKLIQVHLVKRNPDSAPSRALAFLVG